MIYRNYDGFAHAKELVAHGKISHKAFAFSDEDERALLGPDGTDLARHRMHHLGVDDDHPPASPRAHRYPFAKDGQVYTRALHGIRNAAQEAGHESIRDAASQLLGEIKSRTAPHERDELPAGDRRHIVKDGGKYRLYSKDGHKLLGTHDTKEGAEGQEEAVKQSEASAAAAGAGTAGGRSILALREVRSIRSEVTVRDTADGPVICGYGIVFNSDSSVLTDDDGSPFIETINPKAVEKILASNPDVRGLGNHDPNHLLGRTKSGTMTLRADDVGVHYEIKPPKSAIGEQYVESVRRGDMDGSSFGFNVAEGGERWDTRSNPPRREVTEIRDLFDIGPVTFPAYANSSAATRSLRSLTSAGSPTFDAKRVLRQRTRALTLIFPHLKG